MKVDAPIYVAGHTGLVGGAVLRRLRAEGCCRLITRTHAELDLTDRGAVERFFAAEEPAYVFLAAAKVGGIHANNTQPADFIRANLLIQTNVIDTAWRHGVARLLFLGSSCIYPRNAAQPMAESALLTGPLEPTNSAYAVAKLAGLEMCAAYRRQYGFDAIAAMPANLYGPGDNFDDAETSHVLPALLRRFHEAKVSGAKRVAVWGTGTPRREFLHVADLADACVFLMRHFGGAADSGGLGGLARGSGRSSFVSANGGGPAFINVGTGEDLTIRELAGLIAEIIGYAGEIVFDSTRLDGTPRKLLDISRLTELGWRPQIELADGIRATYAWYLERYDRTPPAGGKLATTRRRG